MSGKPSDADLLSLPKIPKPKKDDPEDVAWALSTAEAMWSRAENGDAIKWIRRAAEAASEAEADDRALELAKAAADLAAILVKADAGPVSGASQSVAAPPPVSKPPVSAAPPPPRSVSPPSAKPPPPASRPASSRAPSGRPPPAPSVSPPRSVPPKANSVPPRASASPLSSTGSVPKAPTPSRTPPPQAVLPKATVSRATERRRRSGHNLADEARRATEVDPVSSEPQGVKAAVAAPAFRSRRRSRPSHGETLVDNKKPAHDDLSPDTDERPAVSEQTQTTLTAQDADDWPTQALTRRDVTDELGKETLGVPAVSPRQAERAVLDASQARQADPGALATSQAVRVVVWRGPDGVHVAPAGTRVSAITVDALLVALDPSADLAAWLKE